MKRLVALSLAVMMVFSLAACGNKNSSTPASGANSTSPSVLAEMDRLSDYDTSLVVAVGETGEWTPFNTGGTLEFRNANADIIYVSGQGETLNFEGLSVGETTLGATQNGTTKTALVKVVPSSENGTFDLTVWYAEYIINDLQHLDSDAQIEYLLSLGDYMTLELASREIISENFMAIGEAACMIYPHVYLINNYAAMLMRCEAYEDALKWLTEANKAEQGNPVVLVNMGQCLFALGEYESAMQFAAEALASEPNYGLAHLLQTAIHLQNGNYELAIETLFKSYRSCWNDTSLRFSNSLMDKVSEGADDYDTMLLTDYHIDLLFEAVSAGSEPDGRDIPENQLSLPYPVNPADVLWAGDVWWEKGEAIRQENLAANDVPTDGSAEYTGTYSGKQGKDARQAYCASFLEEYYEYKIEKTSYYPDFTAYEEQETALFAEKEQARYEEYKQADKEAQKAVAATSMSREILWQYNYVTEPSLRLAYLEEVLPWAETLNLDLAKKRMDIYEATMRPLLEEYYLKVNAMLGYMTDDEMRLGFECRAVKTINYYALVAPMKTAEVGVNTADYISQINGARKTLEKGEIVRAEQREAEINARKTENGQLKNYLKKDYGFGELTVTIPPGFPVYVKFGIVGDTLQAGYGAYGNEILHAKNVETGDYHYTIMTRTSVLPFGLGELGQIGNSIRDVLTAKTDANGFDSFIAGKVVGGIPSFDRTVGEGKTYTFDDSGREKDVSIIKETNTSVSWGALNVGQKTTTQHSGVLGTDWNVRTTQEVSFGPLTFSE